MTARELIALLSTFPPDVPVIAEWEGTWNTITPAGVQLTETRGGRPMILIEVDGGRPYDGTSERVYEDEDVR